MSSNLAQYILPLAILAVAIALLFGLWNMLRAGSASRSQTSRSAVWLRSRTIVRSHRRGSSGCPSRRPLQLLLSSSIIMRSWSRRYSGRYCIFFVCVL